MKLPSINLNSLRNLSVQFIKNLSWIFFGAFLILLLFEVFELNKSLQIILNVDQEPIVSIKDKGERINFDNYDWVVNRVLEGNTFTPTNTVIQNPFGTLTQ